MVALVNQCTFWSRSKVVSHLPRFNRFHLPLATTNMRSANSVSPLIFSSVKVENDHSLTSFASFTLKMRSTENERGSSTSPDLTESPPMKEWRKWLVQWDITHFAIALAFSAFAAMWKSVCMNYTRLDIPKAIFSVLWFIAVTVLLVVFIIYAARLIIWPSSIVFDFTNPRMVSFFFVPVIIGCIVAIGAPSFVMNATAHKIAFFGLAAYQTALSLFLCGEWLFGTALIDVVHPVVFMQVIGYFLLANLAARLFFVELAVASMTIGGMLWFLLLVTNFQHTSTALERRSEKLQPTFFLFIAPPAQAAIALFLIGAALEGGGGMPNSLGLLRVPLTVKWPLIASAALYVDLFLYGLIFRLFPSFWAHKFAIVWWAYIFPLSAAASATTIRSRGDTTTVFWSILSGVLVSIATIAMVIVTIATVWGLRVGKLPCNTNAVTAYREYAERRAALKTSNHSQTQPAETPV